MGLEIVSRGLRGPVVPLAEGVCEEILRFLAGGSPVCGAGRLRVRGRKGFMVARSGS